MLTPTYDQRGTELTRQKTGAHHMGAGSWDAIVVMGEELQSSVRVNIMYLNISVN